MGRWIPWRSALGVLVAGFALKVLLLSHLGTEAYQLRVASLAVGTPMEQVGAYVLKADQATMWFAAQIEALGR